MLKSPLKSDKKMRRMFKDSLDDIMRREDCLEYIYNSFSKGESVSEYCDNVGVPVDMHYEYVRDNEAYRLAVSRAMTACRAWWDRTGKEAIFDKDVNYRALESQFSRQSNSMPADDVKEDVEKVLHVSLDDGFDVEE